MAWAVAALLLSQPAAAQTPLTPAINLYESASFEDALVALDAAARENLNLADQVVLHRYRVLCLAALGRPEDAAASMATLLRIFPTYRLDDDASPRLQALLDDARRRVLPDVVRTTYAEARAAWDKRDLEAATGKFEIVGELATLLGGGEIIDPALRDLFVVADGFKTLATAALTEARVKAEAVEAERRRAEALEAVEAERRRAEAEAAAAPPAAPLPPTPEVFGIEHADVAPPVAQNTGVLWRRGVPRPRSGTRLGEIEVVIDDTGVVESARVVSSVNAFYDAILLESARTWRYTPARRQGRPVKYRRVVAMSTQ